MAFVQVKMYVANAQVARRGEGVDRHLLGEQTATGHRSHSWVDDVLRCMHRGLGLMKVSKEGGSVPRCATAGNMRHVLVTEVSRWTYVSVGRKGNTSNCGPSGLRRQVHDCPIFHKKDMNWRYFWARPSLSKQILRRIQNSNKLPDMKYKDGGINKSKE